MAKNYSMSNFYCTQCGNKGLPVWRKIGAEREAGHLKILYCLHCKKEVNHVEVRENNKKYTYKDFLTEFNYHNFDENGNRIRTYGKLKEMIHNGKL